MIFSRGWLFHGDEELIILFYPDALRVTGAVLRLGGQRIQGRDGIAVDDGGVDAVLHPNFMTGKDDIVRTVGVLNGDGRFNGPISVDGCALVLIRRVGRTAGIDADGDDEDSCKNGNDNCEDPVS